MKRILFFCSFYLYLFSFLHAEEVLKLIENGQSEYAIVIDNQAPKSVKDAAKELQYHFQKISRFKIPISHTHSGPVISLGATIQKSNAGIPEEKIHPDGFRILTKGKNLYIWGIDTKKGELEPVIGFSMGTLFGTYAFLEDQLGIKWIMPGKEGEIIPQQSSVSIPQLKINDKPDFQWRRIPYTGGNRPDVAQWELRNRMNNTSYRMSLHHYHAWHAVVPPKHFSQHPEWFAEINGKRAKPTGDRYKLCTTNTEMIDFYANELIEYFNKHPKQLSKSLSPTDSAGYCQCSKCNALDEKSELNGRPSKTRRILLFYNEVTKRVAKVHPQKMLCGYVYADFLKPPEDKAIQLHSSLFLVIAPHINYGYQYYRPDVQKQWLEIMTYWSQYTKNISYYDIILQTQNKGAPTGLAKEIYKEVYPKLKELGVKGTYMYGNSAWGHSAAFNWLTAKLNWNANLDVDKASKDFFNAAYGEAGPTVEKLYDLIDLKQKEYYKSHPKASYPLTQDILKEVFAKNIGELENLYKIASKIEISPVQKNRLNMLGENIKILYQNMLLLQLVSDSDDSVFKASEEDIKEIRQKRKGSLALPKAPSVSTKRPPRLSTKLFQQSSSVSEAMKSYRLRGNQYIVFQATSDDLVNIELSNLKVRGNPISYSIIDSLASPVKSGMLAKDTSITFPGKSGQYYHFYINSNGGSFEVQIKDIPWVVSTKNHDRLHFLGKTTPVYFYVPKGLKEFSLDLRSSFPHETAEAKLYNSAGKLVKTFTTIDKPVDTQSISSDGLDGTYWKLVIGETSKANLDDVFISFAKSLTGFVTLDPKNFLIVQE